MKIPNINYDNAREEYLNYLKNNSGLIEVIEFGEIKSPGLSDIDWLIIFDKDKIENSNMLLPRENFSMNFKNAFQHRPIFLEKKYIPYIGEFILPTNIKFFIGSLFDINIFKSISEEERNISVGFDFFKRQKNWLREPIFYKLPFKKRIALFVSISKHSINPIFRKNKINWKNYRNEVNQLRINILKEKFEEILIEKVRTNSIKIILQIEKILFNWVLKNYQNVMNKKQYYYDVRWGKSISFNQKENILIENLKVFPILYKNYNNDSEYFFKKYILIKSISLDLKIIGLKDGIIADLGFNNWFPKSLKDHLYNIRKKLENI